MECKFCLHELERLEISHIIPKFVYRWLKITSTTGRMRDGRNMKRPAQDGLKKDLLCSACENDFSASETYFANKIFSQMTKNDGAIESEEIDWMKFDKFILSLVWRTLYFAANTKEANADYTEEEILEFNKCADILKSSYEKEEEIPFKTYLIPLNNKSYNNRIIEIEDYAYFERSVSVNLIIDDDNNQASTLYIKLPYAMIVCEVRNCINHPWKGLCINNRDVFSAISASIPKHVHNYIARDRERCYEMANDIPQHQVEKLKKILATKGNPSDGTVQAIIKNRNRKTIL